MDIYYKKHSLVRTNFKLPSPIWPLLLYGVCMVLRFKRFKCTKCGVCCRAHVKGKKAITMDENGVLYTMEQDSRMISLWRWEADRVKKKASEMGISLKVRPLSFIVDGKGSQAIIILWYLDHGACPFIDDGDACSIWKDRPFTCKTFPLYGHRTGIGLSSLCPDLVRPPLRDDEEENGRTILEIYPDEITCLFKDFHIYRTLFGFIRDLEENDIIVWDKAPALEEAGRMIERPETRIDLFDLVIDNGVLTRSKVKEIYRELDSVDDVKGKVELRISRNMVGV
jgi:Fe-S-cluster containining protein